jgi:hypothetical protein
MRKIARFLVISFFLVILAGAIDSRINAQQNKWVRYHGDFASFNIRWDYQLDYQKKGRQFTYKLATPGSEPRELIISKGHSKMNFKLSDRKGYVTAINRRIPLAGTGGIEKAGTTPSGTKWREMYLYYMAKGAKGANLQLIYVAYDDVSDDVKKEFDDVISSIQLKEVFEPENSSATPPPIPMPMPNSL